MSYTVCRLSGDAGNRAIQKLWNDNRPGKLDTKLLWYYENNPAGSPLVCIAHDGGSGQAVGCVALFPRLLSVDGVAIKAGIAGDFFVRQDHRVLLPALKLQKELIACVEEKKFDLVYGLPNSNSAGVMKRAGFRRLGPEVRVSKPIKTSQYLKNTKYVGRFAAILSPVLDFALLLFSLDTWYRVRGRFAFEEVDVFDDRFDFLWEGGRRTYSVAGNRTSEYLSWKFTEKPSGPSKIFTICDSSSRELAGYIVYEFEKTYISIRDFVFPENSKTIRIFLAHFLRHVRHSHPTGVMIELLKKSDYLSVLSDFGFVARRNDRHTYYYYAHQDLSLQFPQLADPEQWLLTNFDIDG